jgi:hypothetical protein
VGKGVTAYLRRHHVALLALFVALGGTSVAAANLINGKQIKPNSIPKNRLTKAAIAGLKGNRGAGGPTGARGATGLQGSKGNTGSQGVPGTARAWAGVLTNGTLDGPRSHNVTSVIHLNGSGLYCLELDPSVPATTTGAAASPYYPGDLTNTTQFAQVEFGGHCGLNGVEVETRLVTGSGSALAVTLVDQAFFAAIP